MILKIQTDHNNSTEHFLFSQEISPWIRLPVEWLESQKLNLTMSIFASSYFKFDSKKLESDLQLQFIRLLIWDWCIIPKEIKIVGLPKLRSKRYVSNYKNISSIHYCQEIWIKLTNTAIENQEFKPNNLSNWFLKATIFYPRNKKQLLYKH